MGDPKVMEDPKVTGVSEVMGDPKAMEVPKGFRDPGVPNVIVEDPNALGVPKAMRVPKTMRVPKSLNDPGVPNVMEDPNTLEDPKTLENPNALEDPNTFEDPNGLEDPKTLENPKTLEDPNALKDPSALEDPNALDGPNAPEDPNAPGAAAPPWDRVVFVLPAFEVRTGVPVPGTKAELLQLWGRGAVRPFYGALCPRCQAPTGYGRWRGLPPAPRLRVAYEAPWRDPWEPFYVGPAHGVPPFDERFLQYGFNRISQACELHMAGFRFAVLDGAFVVHRGFKEAGGFHGAREAELSHNRQLYRRFRDELRLRYPRSTRRC